MSALHFPTTKISLSDAKALLCNSSSGALDLPDQKNNIIRQDATLHKNGHSIMSAATMYYGGAKTGKTRLVVSAFKGSNYIFLDFDRNYKSTINEIIKAGARYYNGKNAIDILSQVMLGKAENEIIIIDALGSVVKGLCRAFIREHTNINEDKTETKDWEAVAVELAIPGIGTNHTDTATFFNHIIEPMTRNNNSINFVHHTTQNMSGEKMEGNKGAWLSVFDFTYQMDRETRTFKLEADRLPIAPKTIGFDNVYARINRILKENAESIEIETENEDGSVETTNILLTPFKKFSDNKTTRLILNPLIQDGLVKKFKSGKKEYLETRLVITSEGQCEKVDDVLTPMYTISEDENEVENSNS